MADLDFLALRPNGNSDIIVRLPDGAVSRISGLCHWIIGNACPLLGHALSDGPLAHHQATIEAEALTSVTAFLRYLYVGSYLTPSEHDCHAPSISLLKHVEVYKLAKDYDVPQLQQEARFHFLRGTECAMSFPNAPPHLCEAVRFIYKHLADQEGLVDTLLNYCVAAFKAHSLGTNAAFRQIAFEIPDFHKDLCKTNYNRNFKDEGAAEIVCLPCPPVAQSDTGLDNCLQSTNRIHSRFTFTEWHDSEYTESEGIAEIPHMNGPKKAYNNDSTLALRPRDTAALENVSGSEQNRDEDGFTLVYRPRVSGGQNSGAQSLSQTSVYGSDATSDAVWVNYPSSADDTPDLEVFDDFFDSLLGAQYGEYISVEPATSASPVSEFDHVSLHHGSDPDTDSEWSVL